MVKCDDTHTCECMDPIEGELASERERERGVWKKGDIDAAQANKVGLGMKKSQFLTTPLV